MSRVRRSTRLNNNASSKSSVYREIERSSDDEFDDIENYNMNSPIRTPRRIKNSKFKKNELSTKTEPKTPISIKKRDIKRRQPSIILSESDLENSSDEKLNEIIKSAVTPPKQQKFDKNPLSIFSPSRLLDRLSIEDYENSKTNNIDNKVNQNDSEKAQKKEFKINKYQNARRVLNSAETNLLPGREKELEELTNYFEDHLNNKKSGSLYVSGQPGTGKTACLSKLLKSNEFASKFTKVYINCTSVSTIGNIYKKICTELNINVNGRIEKDYLNAIENYLVGKHKMILMVLDEIDQLCGQKQTVLYTIFEWPSLVNSRILLIGIANSLDLTDRMLIRLNARCELKPKLMHFAPYNKQQIIDIFKSRLEEAGVMDIFPPVTIQLLAAKVSAISGDVRRALDIGRRVIQIAEREKNSNDKFNLKECGIEELCSADENDDDVPLKPVQLQQVVSVLNNVYGASQTLNDDIDGTFPLQQKILLCSLMLMLKKGKNKDITIGRLHDVYKRVCNKKNILAVDQAEFVGLCNLVDTRGIIRVIGKKEPRLNKIVLQWDETEVNQALKDKQLIATILDDVSCLER